MTAFLLSAHVLAAIIAIGPVAVAASMFPPAARAAREHPDRPEKAAATRLLHRITRVYAVIGILVPVFGIATGWSLGVLGDAWLIVSMLVTVGAAAVLIGLILPAQRRILADIEASDSPPLQAPGVTAGLSRRLAMHTGMFNLLWAVVVVLMITRPGSTTGAGS
jgi:uncharacterized membrane protein